MGAATVVGVAVVSYIALSSFSGKKAESEEVHENVSCKRGNASSDSLQNESGAPSSQLNKDQRGGSSAGDNDNSVRIPNTDKGTRKGLTLADVVISEPTVQDSEQMTAEEETSAQVLSAAIASKSSLPRTATKSYSLGGVSTDMFVQIFSDRVVLGASQLNGKFGNYMMCQAVPDEVNPKHVEYEVTSLLGAREDTMLTVYARQITERIQKLQPNPTPMTVVIALSLNKEKAPEPEVFRSIVELLLDMYRQSAGC